MSVKRAIQSTIREVHRIVASRDIPQKLAIYFHELEREQYPEFSDCMEYWKSEGYRFVNASDFVSADEGRLLFVSFDDNYRSWHAALPLFDSLGLAATFYVNTLPIRGSASARDIESFFDRINHGGERVPLSKEEIREIASAGHTIGCHSHSHFDLASIPEDDAKSEILVSKEILQDTLQREVADFSYPFGMRRHFTDRLRDFCFEKGFRTICNAIPGWLHEAPCSRSINRTGWDFGRTLDYNVDNMKIDGRLFEQLTSRSAVV